MKDIDSTIDKLDVSLGIKRGNHKGATNQPGVLHKHVTLGFALPITIDTATKMQRGICAPLSIQDQSTINEKEERMRKKMLTYEQSFACLPSNISVNEYANHDELEPLIYGFIFLSLKYDSCNEVDIPSSNNHRIHVW